IRRAAIVVILALAYAYYRMVGNAFALASIGLISFAAIAQFAPAFFIGLMWRRANEKGAIAGILSGFLMWAYTLLLPSFVNSGWFDNAILLNGPFGIEFLRPEALFFFNTDPLTHGVVWSLAANVFSYVVVSLATRARPDERQQARIFTSEGLHIAAPSFRLSRASVSVRELKATVARYLGDERTLRSFSDYASERKQQTSDDDEADAETRRFAERLLASAIGNASARLVLAINLKRKALKPSGARRLLVDASEAIQYSRDLLKSAIDHVGQGISVFDENLRLVCWNRQFRDLLGIPAELGRVGVPLSEILRHLAEQGRFGPGDVERIVTDRIEKMIVTMQTYQERLSDTGQVIEVRSNPMPGGGVVTTYSDITQKEEAAEALTRANETLERRVRERTLELTVLNKELARAKARAEDANLGKTRFLAAASHDILQPLNAARLYTSSLVERKLNGDQVGLARNIDASLEAVEEILGVLLDISRLDAGALKPEFSTVDLGALLGQLQVEFTPQAAEKNLELRVVATTAAIRSDRRLLRRVLQNLLSNAIKYTDKGAIVLGCRRQGDKVRIEVHDTGPGIEPAHQQRIFREFHRLDSARPRPPGLGLGLSIVERIAAVLDHRIGLESRVGHGSTFSLEAPRARAGAVVVRARRKSRTAVANLTGMVVLVIDNDARILDGMKALLGNWGCEVVTAQTSAQARAALRQFTPDMVLADYHLDDGNGIDAVGDLRAHAGADLPAILVTADRSQLIKARAKQSGLAMLHKPIKPAALRALMAQTRLHRSAAE
ncbi:MAG: hybrid sensor histidine kinase/response regulator, partial [Alphaproteobacteria bacterium]